MDMVYKQRAWDDVSEKEHVIKTGLKWSHLKHLPVCIMHHYGVTFRPFSGSEHALVSL